CLVKKDLNLAMVTNHMHTYGSSAYTEIIHPDNTTDMVRKDTGWSPEYQFNPQYTQYTLQSPKVLHAGDKFHTHCEWNNTTASAMMFPDEMCAGIGFYFPSQGQIICENG